MGSPRQVTSHPCGHLAHSEPGTPIGVYLITAYPSSYHSWLIKACECSRWSISCCSGSTQVAHSPIPGFRIIVAPHRIIGEGGPYNNLPPPYNNLFAGAPTIISLLFPLNRPYKFRPQLYIIGRPYPYYFKVR